MEGLEMPFAGQTRYNTLVIASMAERGRVMNHRVFPIARGSSAALWFCGVIG
jgi:hypothetical protein